MQIRINIILVTFLFLILIPPQFSFSQKINVDLQNVDSLITNNDEDKLLDLNGDICSLAIINTDQTNLKFYTNLYIEKIKKTEYGYKIWFPYQVTVLKFTIPGFYLFEYKLPNSNFKYSVYIISIEALRSETVVIKDTSQPSLSFSTLPTKAKIFLNGKYEGKSPIIIKNPDFGSFVYSIKKKAFCTYSTSDTMDRITKNILVELTNLYKDKRFFLTINSMLDIQRLNTPENPGGFRDGDAYGVFGVTLGIFGKTGIYGTLRYLDRTGFNYMYTQKFCIASGVTQQLGKSIFLYGGPGYMKRYYQNKRDNSTKESKSLYLNAGLIFRIGWYSLLQLDFGKSVNSKYQSIGLGVGLNFPKKKEARLYYNN